MIVEIKKGKAKGNIIAPPSKSMAHRMLICAGLADGVSKIEGINDSEDILATLDCLTSIGVTYEHIGDSITIKGTDIRKAVFSSPLKCRESGSTLRFFVPICLTSGNNAVMTGSNTLLHRPLGVYQSLCNENGLIFSQDDKSIMLRGPLKAGKFKVLGNISSQFISGLLFVLPLLDGDSEVNIVPPIESRSYIALTLKALSLFGVTAAWKNENTIFIKGNQKYNPCNVTVEGDYSNSAFFEALNCFDSNVNIEGLDTDSIQGDKVYKKYFDLLCKGTPTIHIADCPDLGPILFGIAAAKNGGVFTGTKRLRIKESDRGTAMAEELRKFGTAVSINEDNIVVFPKNFNTPKEDLEGHNDHRIVMALSILLTQTGGKIKDSQAIAKSFPDFFIKLKSLGIEVNEYEN